MSSPPSGATPAAIEATGKKFGAYTCLGYSHRGNYNRVYVRVQCDCGARFTIQLSTLRRVTNSYCKMCKYPSCLGERRGGMLCFRELIRNKKMETQSVCVCGRVNTHSKWKFERIARSGFCSCAKRFGHNDPQVSLLHHKYNVCKSNAKKKSKDISFDISVEYYAKIAYGDCYVCGAPPAPIAARGNTCASGFINGVDRIDSDIGYVTGNCAPCCKSCNTFKNDLSLAEFVARCERLSDVVVARSGVFAEGVDLENYTYEA